MMVSRTSINKIILIGKSMGNEYVKTKVDLYAVIPFFHGLTNDQIEWNRYNELIRDILQTSNETVSIEQIINNHQVDSIISQELNAGILSINTILKFTYNCENLLPDFTDTVSQKLAKNIYISENNKSAVNFLYGLVCDLITSSNILMPGILSVRKFIIYLNDEHYRSFDCFAFLNTIQVFSSKASSSIHLQSESLTKAFLWLTKLKNNNYYSTSPLGRAVGALNHLLYSDLHESIAIIWTLVAIEALYCRDDIMAKRTQIAEKAILVSSKLKNSKIIKKMYDARSEFLHGSKDFPIYPMLPAYGLLKDNNLIENEKNLHTALILLFETLQFMMIHNKYELDFIKTYTLK